MDSSSISSSRFSSWSSSSRSSSVASLISSSNSSVSYGSVLCSGHMLRGRCALAAMRCSALPHAARSSFVMPTLSLLFIAFSFCFLDVSVRNWSCAAVPSFQCFLSRLSCQPSACASSSVMSSISIFGFSGSGGRTSSCASIFSSCSRVFSSSRFRYRIMSGSLLGLLVSFSKNSVRPSFFASSRSL